MKTLEENMILFYIFLSRERERKRERDRERERERESERERERFILPLAVENKEFLSDPAYHNQDLTRTPVAWPRVFLCR